MKKWGIKNCKEIILNDPGNADIETKELEENCKFLFQKISDHSKPIIALKWINKYNLKELLLNALIAF